MAQTRSKSTSPKKKTSTPRRPLATEQVKPKPTRRPRQCQRCPGRPLLSTCEHRFRKRTIDHTLPVPQPAGEAPRSPESQPVSATVAADAAFLQVLDPRLVQEEQEARARMSGTMFTVSTAPPATPPRSPPATASVPSTVASTSPPSSPISTLSTPRRPAMPPQVEKRRQPSGVNAKWGKVQGAGRGNNVWEVHRVRELKPPITEQALATRKLERWTVDLISRAEAISTRTGCWLYLAIQHPSSKTPFTHFTSRKLRNDAPTDVELIHKQVRHTMNSLTRGHKRRMFEAEKELEAANAKASSATERAERAEEELLRIKQVLLSQGIAIDK